MDWNRHRLTIGGGALIVMVVLAYWVVGQRTGDSPISDDRPSLPELERDRITQLTIRLPGDDAGAEGAGAGNAGAETAGAEGTRVRLERAEAGWRLAEPVQAAAGESAVTTALDKLVDLEVVGLAASKPQHHEALEVDSGHGLQVIAKQGETELVNLWIGAYRSGNTMVRQDGHDEVLMVRGSIKFAFNKSATDWRDKTISDLTAGDVAELKIENEHGVLRFAKRGDAWQRMGASGGTAPADDAEFDPAKVSSLVSSIARLNAVDFAAEDVTPEAAGLGPQAASVTLVARTSSAATEETQGASEGEEASAGSTPEADPTESASGEAAATEGGEVQTLVLRVGAEVDAESHNRYLSVDGEDTIYVVSSYIGERLLADASAFARGAEEEAGEAAPPTAPSLAAPPAGGTQLPPEIMEQIQRQLKKQG